MSIKNGFIKRAQEAGYTEGQAVDMFKSADVQEYLRSLYAEHPDLINNIGAGVGGAGLGALTAGKGNRLAGAVAGGALGSVGQYALAEHGRHTQDVGNLNNQLTESQNALSAEKANPAALRALEQSTREYQGNISRLEQDKADFVNHVKKMIANGRMANNPDPSEGFLSQFGSNLGQRAADKGQALGNIFSFK